MLLLDCGVTTPQCHLPFFPHFLVSGHTLLLSIFSNMPNSFWFRIFTYAVPIAQNDLPLAFIYSLFSSRFKAYFLSLMHYPSSTPQLQVLGIAWTFHLRSWSQFTITYSSNYLVIAKKVCACFVYHWILAHDKGFGSCWCTVNIPVLSRLLGK